AARRGVEPGRALTAVRAPEAGPVEGHDPHAELSGDVRRRPEEPRAGRAVEHDDGRPGGIAALFVGEGATVGETQELLLNELDERAERRLRVHEGDGRSPTPRPGHLVDDLKALALDPFQRRRAIVDAVGDVVDPLALLVEVLGNGGVVAHGREQLDVRLRHLQQHLLDPVLLDDLAVHGLDAVGLAVVLDGAVEIAHGDGHVVDLGDDGIAHAPAPLWWRRNRVIWSRCCSRSSGSVTPRPSSGDRQRTPTFPSTRLWCTWAAASPVSSSGYTTDSVGWIRPSPISRLASHASR